MTTQPLASTPSLVLPLPEAWSWAWIGENLWDMPAGIGALIGALIGFFALIYVTNKGYRNLIAAQAHRAELDRETIYTAIAADLDAFRPSLIGFRDSLEGGAWLTERNAGRSALLANCNVIWEACAPKIGLLDPNHAANITEIYRFIDAFIGRVAALDLGNPDHHHDLICMTDAVIKELDTVLADLPFRPDRRVPVEANSSKSTVT